MSIFDNNQTYSHYSTSAHNQKKAADILIDLLEINNNDKIIDIGCGDGNNAYKLSQSTNNIVTGIDSSSGMIDSCNLKYSSIPNLKFKKMSADNITEINEYNIAFCNSVMHWFKHPQNEIKKILACLKPSGIFALQSPTKDWSPFIMEIIDQTMKSSEMRYYYERYNSPWFHLLTESEYYQFLINCGFTRIIKCFKQEVINERCSTDKIIDMFRSGPEAAYFNQENYNIPLPDDYKIKFISIYKRLVEKVTHGQNTDVSYNRVFIIAQK
ncbi:methyltransferase domain-containing protein [Cysteiniphilum litorale]|uniref:methyltransferase domain-containing protein n=1 Tax=Cysteiniphilum litorale TaxID=2056700 RepID=UPI003F882D2E